MHRLLLVLLVGAALSCSQVDPLPLGESGGALRQAPLGARLADVREVGDGRPALEPRFSPDGSRVALTGLRYRGLRIAPVDGGPATPLSDEPAAGLRPTWSPDGRQIAYTTLEADGSSVLRVRSVSGGEAIEVHRAGRDEPRPFPHFVDGTLAFLSGDKLRTAGAAAPLSGPLSEALLVAPMKGGLLVAGASGLRYGARTLLDGRRIFDLAPGPGGRTALARELTDGGGALWSIDQATGQAVHLEGYDRGCILPSGRIVAERLEGDGLLLTSGELWLIEADGSRAARIEGVPVRVPYRVACAPQGSLVAFGDDATDRAFVARLEVAP